MIWFLIWIVLAGFVLGVFGWQLLILRQQKQAWQAYAKRHKLEYDAGTFYAAPAIKGDVGGKQIAMYTDSQQTQDLRGQRFVTVIEIEIGSGMPTGAAIGTQNMKSFIDTLVFDRFYTPEHEQWDSSYVLRTRDEKTLRAYLTKERLDALTALFKLKSSSVLYFFDELEAVQRIETTDPLRDVDHMEKIMRRILALAGKLSLTAEERARFDIDAPPAVKEEGQQPPEQQEKEQGDKSKAQGMKEDTPDKENGGQ